MACAYPTMSYIERQEVRVIAARAYERAAKRLLSRDERTAAEASIVSRPDAWPIIPGTGGARKARIALQGRGKRGGARMIYFFSTADGVVVFFDIYAKNQKDDLTDDDKRALKAGIAEVLDALASR